MQPNVRAACRSGISRAYYALFLLTREFFEELGFEPRRIPNPHVTLQQALRNCGVLSLERIADTLRDLCIERNHADYDMRCTEVETVAKVDVVVDAAKTAILQLDLIRAGRFSPPLDREGVANAILQWARVSGKPLWRKT